MCTPDCHLLHDNILEAFFQENGKFFCNVLYGTEIIKIKQRNL